MQRTLRLAVVSAIMLGFLVSATPAFADFVCPVLKPQVGAHNPNAVAIGGGDYTVIPGKADHLNVPDHATNMDGAGTPPGTHARPGDRDYTAIWNSQ